MRLKPDFLDNRARSHIHCCKKKNVFFFSPIWIVSGRPCLGELVCSPLLFWAVHIKAMLSQMSEQVRHEASYMTNWTIATEVKKEPQCIQTAEFNDTCETSGSGLSQFMLVRGLNKQYLVLSEHFLRGKHRFCSANTKALQIEIIHHHHTLDNWQVLF